MTEETKSNLPPITRHITTHRPLDAKAVIHSSESPPWQPFSNNQASFNLQYTTSTFPTQMTNEIDIHTYNSLISSSSSSSSIGLVNRGGSVCRIVDFPPGNQPLMHRTKSLDYGVVLEGEMEMMLDSGESVRMKRGDVAVQRATMHAWRNVTEGGGWGRMMFVLLDAEELEVGGRKLGEDLGSAEVMIPASNNA